MALGSQPKGSDTHLLCRRASRLANMRGIAAQSYIYEHDIYIYMYMYMYVYMYTDICIYII